MLKMIWKFLHDNLLNERIGLTIGNLVYKLAYRHARHVNRKKFQNVIQSDAQL